MQTAVKNHLKERRFIIIIIMKNQQLPLFWISLCLFQGLDMVEQMLNLAHCFHLPLLHLAMYIILITFYTFKAIPIILFYFANAPAWRKKTVSRALGKR